MSIATNNLPKQPEEEKAYVVLPGHPFYGKRVAILQSGKTETQSWSLINHPKKPGFHYRIPSRWLGKIPPEVNQSHSYYQQQITLSFNHLQKLASFINCKINFSEFDVSTEVNVPCSLESIENMDANAKKTNEENPGNLEQVASETKNGSGV